MTNNEDYNELPDIKLSEHQKILLQKVENFIITISLEDLNKFNENLLELRKIMKNKYSIDIQRCWLYHKMIGSTPPKNQVDSFDTVASVNIEGEIIEEFFESIKNGKVQEFLEKLNK